MILLCTQPHEGGASGTSRCLIFLRLGARVVDVLAPRLLRKRSGLGARPAHRRSRRRPTATGAADEGRAAGVCPGHEAPGGHTSLR